MWSSMADNADAGKQTRFIAPKDISLDSSLKDMQSQVPKRGDFYKKRRRERAKNKHLIYKKRT